MSDALAKLTVWHGERAQAGGRFLADALAERFAAARLPAAVVLRGIEGFGSHHRLRTDELLTLSEDLPLAAMAVGPAASVQAIIDEVPGLAEQGFATVEGARIADPAAPRATRDDGAIKLTAWAGRGGGAPGALLDALHAGGAAAAIALLGLDGTLRGERRRARFAGANAGVPVAVLAVVDAARLPDVLARVDAVLPRDGLLTEERARICKLDGARLAPPHDPSSAGDAWQRLTVYAGETVHHRLVRELRRAGARGATTLRGVRGFHGAQRPHGDVLWQLRRRAPLVTTLVDEPAHVARWFPVVDALTAGDGLVTSELVPRAHDLRA